MSYEEILTRNGIDLTIKERQVNYHNVQYGMLVEVYTLNERGEISPTSGYHAGCKVYFFNKKGVLVGNYYEFLPYKRLRLRESFGGKNRDYPRYFMDERFEKIKMYLFVRLCRLITNLIKLTQSQMHKL